MTNRDRAADIQSILAEATQHAYDQGWNDCLEAFRQAAKGEPPTGRPIHVDLSDMHDRRRRGGRPNTSAAAVVVAIMQNPGKTGAEIAAECSEIHERTVR